MSPQNNNLLLSVHELARRIDKRICDDMDLFNKYKNVVEEGIEANIIDHEKDMKGKIEERLLVASHIIVFPWYFSRLDKASVNRFASLFRLLGLAFAKCQKETTALFLPLLSFTKDADFASSSIKETIQDLRKRSIVWINTEIPFLKSSPTLTLRVLTDLVKFNIQSTPPLYQDPNHPHHQLLEQISRTCFLPLEAKIALLSRMEKLFSNETHTLVDFFMWEEKISASDPDLLKREMLYLLKKIK